MLNFSILGSNSRSVSAIDSLISRVTIGPIGSNNNESKPAPILGFSNLSFLLVTTKFLIERFTAFISVKRMTSLDTAFLAKEVVKSLYVTVGPSGAGFLNMIIIKMKYQKKDVF